jgi:hypothetical protein
MVDKFRRISVALALAVSPAASAQADGEAGFEFGARYWVSTGMTRWAHNAQGANPALGNPTSILTYDNLDASVGELYARAGFAERWFVKGNFGLGRINTGNFDDEDYFARQVKFSDTTSSVKGDRVVYAGIDLGLDVWRSRGSNETVLAVFAGAQRWTERVNAYGATPTVGGVPNIPNNVPVISNEVTWTSLRLGLEARGAPGRGLRLTGEVALIPYTRMRNEDSHYLRQSPNDLGPVPNVINKGEGVGVQAEFELRWSFYEDYELALGGRYWWLKTTSGTNSIAGRSFPLVYQESERLGATLGLSRRW